MVEKSELEELKEQRDILLQAMWDARTALGFDTDGDKQFHIQKDRRGIEMVAREHVREAQEIRKDYDDLLDEGGVVSAVVERLSTIPDAHPKLQPNERVHFEGGREFVVREISSRDGEVNLTLQDFPSYERANMVQAIPSQADWGEIKAARYPGSIRALCRCDGPPHPYGAGWCPDSGPVS